MNESKRLIEYVTKRHEIKPVDETCQFKGGKGEKFCRATSQKTCEGCRFYRMAIWQVFNRAYDLLTAKDKQIKQLTDDNNKLMNALQEATTYAPEAVRLKINQLKIKNALKTLFEEG